METKIDLSPEALKKRKEIAENATKGEWETITYGMEGNYVVISPIVDLNDSLATVKREEDCFHIAASSPGAVIAMIDEIERLRDEIAADENKE